jgi:hypothetical protein
VSTFEHILTLNSLLNLSLTSMEILLAIVIVGGLIFTFWRITQFANRKSIAQRNAERQYAREYEASGSSTIAHEKILKLGALRGMDELQLGVMNERLLNQVRFATNQAIESRRESLQLGAVALLMPTLSTLVSGISGTFPPGVWQTNALLTVSGMSAIASIAQILSSLMGQQKTWFESRKTNQLVIGEIYSFLGSTKPYNSGSLEADWRLCFSNCQGHIARSQESELQLIESGARAEEALKGKDLNGDGVVGGGSQTETTDVKPAEPETIEIIPSDRLGMSDDGTSERVG